MKKTRLKQIGKRGQEWINARAKLKTLFDNFGIIECELRFPKCWRNSALGFAHRHKRQWYYAKPARSKLLGSVNQVLLACNICHDVIENDAELTDKMFQIKRPIKLS